MKFAKLVLTFSSAAALSACGMIKTMDEMHDSTDTMKNTTAHMDGTMDKMYVTTDGMAGTMGGMSEKMGGMAGTMGGMSEQMGGMAKDTSEVKDTSCEMYSALRQSDSLAARRNGLKALADADAGSPKISEAGKYFMSFEYQVYSEACADSNHSRDLLASDAAKEFMRDVHQFIAPGQTKPSPFAKAIVGIGKEDANREQSLNALAVGMHMLNPKQEVFMKAQKQPTLSMWDMIKTSLAAAKQIEAGKKKLSDYPDYVKQILIYEGAAKLLVQARFNFFGAMMISRATKIREGAALKMAKSDWELDISEYGIVEVQEFGVYLNAGNLVAKFMGEIGMKPQVDEKLQIFLGNMKLSNSLKAAATADLAKATPRVAAEAEFLKALLTYRRLAGIEKAL